MNTSLGLFISNIFEVVRLRWRKVDIIIHIVIEKQHLIHSLRCWGIYLNMYDSYVSGRI